VFKSLEDDQYETEFFVTTSSVKNSSLNSWHFELKHPPIQEARVSFIFVSIPSPSQEKDKSSVSLLHLFSFSSRVSVTLDNVFVKVVILFVVWQLKVVIGTISFGVGSVGAELQPLLVQPFSQ